MPKFKTINLSILGIVFTLVIAYVFWKFALDRARKNVEETIPVSIGGHTTQLSAALEIALYNHYYENHGLKASAKRVESSKESMAAMESGELDVVIGSLAAGSFNLVRKADLVIIADGSRVVPNVIVRKDLWQRNEIKQLPDLRGRSIMTPREGSSSYYALSRILRGLGLSIDDIKPKYLDDNATLAALEAKQIDAALLMEPFATNAVQKGLGIRYDLKEVEKFFPPNGQQHMVIYTKRKALQEKPDILRKFLAGYLEGVQFYDRARNGSQPERSEAIRIIAGYTGADSATIENAVWPYVSPDGKPDTTYIREMHDYFVKKGLVDKPLNLADVIHLELLPEGN